MYQRERIARKEAESVLETKSLELWNTNQQLQKSATKLESIFLATSDGIVTFDSNGLVETSNPAAQRIFGYTDSQLLGMHATKLLPDDETRREMSESAFWVDRCTQDNPHVATQGLDSNGKPFDMELSASRGTRDDEVVHIWVLRNTQRINQMERQAMVNQRLQAIGQLAAGMSHEINTPIQYVHENTKFLRDAFASLETLIVAYEEVLSSLGDKVDPGAKSRLSKIAEEQDAEFYRDEVPRAIEETISGSQRVSSIVNAIKEFAHPGGEGKSSFDINKAIESALTVSSHHWKHVADAKTDLQSDLPLLVCFGSEINQVLLNLIINAGDAIADRLESEGIRGQIAIKTWEENEVISISISDTGVGIPRENLGQIFTPFFTTKSIGKGTGQGLALVHSVIANTMTELSLSIPKSTLERHLLSAFQSRANNTHSPRRNHPRPKGHQKSDDRSANSQTCSDLCR